MREVASMGKVKGKNTIVRLEEASVHLKLRRERVSESFRMKINQLCNYVSR